MHFPFTIVIRKLHILTMYWLILELWFVKLKLYDIHQYIYTYIHTYIHACIHTYLHTHIQHHCEIAWLLDNTDNTLNIR